MVMRFGPIKLERIAAFDILRGFFLVVIILNHLYYYPSGLDWLTGRGHLYVSSAEGFFVISGLMLGLVRGRKLIDKPLKAASKLILSRTAQLYIVFVILTIGFTLIAWALTGTPGLKHGYAPLGTSFWQLLWQTLTLQYVYGWIDFLRLYIIFMLATPLALWLLRHGWWYVVLMTSTGVWWLFPNETTNTDGFMLMPISWQLVFFAGLVVGFHWPEIAGAWRRITSAKRVMIGRTFVAAMLVTALASTGLVYGEHFGTALGDQLAQQHRSIEYDNFDKNRLPLGRLVLGTIWFWALFWLVRRYEPQIISRLGWLLTPLGQNSLYVYIMHSFVVFGMHFIWQTQHVEIRNIANLPINLVLSVAAVLLIWYMVKRQWLFKIVPR